MKAYVLQFDFLRKAAVLGTITSVGLVASCCQGQTVQLPTFHSFSTSTTVVIPDRGSVYLGGVNSASRSQSRYGLPFGSRLPGVGRGFGNRGFSSSLSGGGVSVSATIIDLDELDKIVLAEADQLRRFKSNVLGLPVVAKNSSLSSARSHSSASQMRSIGFPANNKYLRLGYQAELDGDFQSAKVFYEMAAERGSPSQNQRAGRRNE